MWIVELIGYFVIFVLSKSDAQNCIYAPTCPSFVTWMPGYICDEGFFPIIRKKSVYGVQTKTICCSENLVCSANNFWCPSDMQNNGFSQSVALSPSCSESCVTQWKPYNNDSEPILFGMFGGLYTSTIPSFIGRARVPNGFLPGRIHINQPGMFYTYSGSEKYANGSVEFLFRNSNYTYGWISSENGSYVANAVTLNVPKTSAQYIGRISVNGGTFIGTVVRILGGMFYSDYSGVEKFTANYEVLVCNKPVVSTTAVSMPVCPIYWKGSTSQQTQSTSAPATLPMVINAQNGILTGDLVHTYSWANLANLSANLITDVTLASLTLPGGLEYSVGRIIVNGATIAGTVDLNTGIMQYTDGYGNLKSVICYEVLICNVSPVTTTPMPFSSSTTSAPFPSCLSTWNYYTAVSNVLTQGIASALAGLTPAYTGQANIHSSLIPTLINQNAIGSSFCFYTNSYGNVNDVLCIDITNCGNNMVSTTPSSGSTTPSSGSTTPNPAPSPTCTSSLLFYPEVANVTTLGIDAAIAGLTPINIGQADIYSNILTMMAYLNLNVQNYCVLTDVGFNLKDILCFKVSSCNNSTITTTPMPISTTPTSVLTTRTSTPVLSCMDNWQYYTGKESISTLGVGAGPSGLTLAYVGQANIYGNILPGMVKVNSTSNTFCFYIGNGNCVSDFQYLGNVKTSSYVWVNSQNGNIESNAIQVQSKFVGKITVNGNLVIGSVIPGFGLVYMSDTTNMWVNATSGYQVLTCSNTATTTTPVPTSSSTQATTTTTAGPPEPCDITWPSYTGVENVTTLGLDASTIGPNPLYIGYVIVNGNLVLGLIEAVISNVRTTMTYCMNLGDGVCNQNFKFLDVIDVYNFTWVDSKNGNIVPFTTKIQSFDVGRVLINGDLFVGKVIPTFGLVYWDYTTNSSASSKTYQVLTCCHLVSPTTSTTTPFSVSTSSSNQGSSVTTSIGPTVTTTSSSGSIVSSTTTSGSVGSTPAPTPTCSFNWIDYTGVESVSLFGVIGSLSGSIPSYIGQTNIYGNSLPGPIQKNSSTNTYCFYRNSGTCISTYRFLVNDGSHSLSWIDSQNGDNVPLAVPVEPYLIGRTVSNGKSYIGSVVPGYGLYYVDFVLGQTVYTNKSYQVLSCMSQVTTTLITDTTTTIPLPDSCVINWPYYTGVEVLAGLAAIADHSGTNPSYIGLTNLYGNILPGTIQFDFTTNLYCLQFGSGACNNDFQYLDNANSYIWVNSQNGEYVENAITVESFNIGKIIINGVVYLGKINPGYGLVYMNETTNLPDFANTGYQVLTVLSCAATTPPTIPTTTTSSVVTTASTTTTAVTTPAPPQNCAINWIQYTGSENIPTNGIDAGASLTFVGQANIYGNILLGTVQFNSTLQTYCLYIGSSDCISDFEYLEKTQNYNFQWISSKNGDNVPYSIQMQSNDIGRVLVNNSIFLGTVMPGYGLSYLTDATFVPQYKNTDYDVLTCSYVPIPVVYDCVNTWTPYLGDIQPLSNGLQTDDGQQTFIGRATANNDFVVGRIQINSPTGLLYLSSGAWNIETATDEYLIKNSSNSYQWVSSSRGLPVQHAISIVKSSNWPMYVGRAVINSTYSFYGRVLPRQGLEFDDGSSTVPLQNYEILTCTSSVVNNILPYCDP